MKILEKLKIDGTMKALLSPPPLRKNLLVRSILNLLLYYPLVIVLLVLIKDKEKYEKKRQNLIKKLNRLHLDPYLGLVKPSENGIFWEGCKISGDNATSLIKAIFINEFYSKPKRNDVVIDVGAHIGVYSIYASKYAKKIIAIEPEPNNFNHLIKNISAKNNIYPFNIALGDLDGKMKLYLHSALGHSLLFPSDEFVEVSVKKLDDLIEQLNLERVDLIKINAEGYELQILKGGEKTLRKFKPSLILDVHHYKNEIEQIADFIEKNGLKEHYVVCIKDGTFLIAERKENNFSI